MKTKTNITLQLERAILYGRVSSDDRLKDGRNLKGQIMGGRKHSKNYNYRIVAELPEDITGQRGSD